MNDKLVVGIFHPYCNAGGGGERVLWCAVRAIQIAYPDCHIFIYTGDKIHPSEIICNVSKQFNVVVQAERVEFIILEKRHWIEASRYPYFTLIGQSLGSIILGIEAVWKCVPGE